MKYENFAIKASEGVFYTTSKTPMDGFVENKYTDRDTKEVRVNYHKHTDSIQGKLKYIGTKETPSMGERFYMSFENESGDVLTTLEIPVFNQNGSINDYVKAFCQVLENLEIGSETIIELNKKTKDKNGYLYKNVYVKQDGQKVNWAFKTFGTDSPVPAPVKTIHKVKKTEVWDFSPIDSFYYDLLKKFAPTRETSAPATSTSGTEQNVPSEKHEPAVVNEPTVEVDNMDDLPF